MTINKYKLYLIVLGILVSCFFLPPLYKFLFWERAYGQVSGFRTQKARRGTHTFPLIYFETEEYEVRFTAPPFTNDILGIGKKVKVVYNSKNPSDAYVNSFYGMWAYRVMYFFPIFLICTAATFGADSLPKKIKFGRKNKSIRH